MLVGSLFKSDMTFEVEPATCLLARETQMTQYRILHGVKERGADGERPAKQQQS